MERVLQFRINVRRMECMSVLIIYGDIESPHLKKMYYR